MMGGGFFDNAFPYNVYGAQPRGGFYHPRADYDQFWYPSRMRQPASPNDSRGEGERVKARARSVDETPVKRNVRTVVVEDGGAKEAASAPQQSPSVKFENSDAAASKIQSVYRGYSVRRTEPLKHLRVICKVKAELQELMRKSCRPEEMEKIRDDPQVRLRWTEGVMALILRLDSLQGVHPVVRDIRKSVAKELICFQERIDSMAGAAKGNLVVNNVDSVEEDSTVEAENEDIKIAEDSNVPDLETEKESALETKDLSDSSVSPVPEDLTKVVTSLVEEMDIGDHLQGKSGESSIPEAEAPIQITSGKCHESDSSVNYQENSALHRFNEVPFALMSSTMAADSSAEVADEVERSTTERVPVEVTSGMDLGGEHEGSPQAKDIELDEDDRDVEICQITDGDATNEFDMDRIPIEGISGMDLEVENKGSPQAEGVEEAVAGQNMKIATASTTAQTFIPQNLQESLMSGDNNPEVANATEPRPECTCLPAADLEEAADRYTGDDSTNTEEQELSTSPVDANDDATVVANQPSWTSLITEPREGDSLQMTLSEPSTTTGDSSLSDRALMLQILEENRKLKAVVGEVLQWGKQQSEVINNLASRVKELEGDFSNAKLLKDCTRWSRKRAGSIAGPIGERERVVRRLENGRNGRWGDGRQIGYINADEQWPSSAESEEFF